MNHVINNEIFLNLHYLHDGDGSDGGIGEWVLVSKGSGSGAALGKAHFKSIHQAGNELNQLNIPENP